MVVDIVQWIMMIMIITMEAKFIVTLTIMTYALMMLIGVVSGFGQLLHHVVKIAGMTMTADHVAKLLKTLPMMLNCLSRRCQATMVTQIILMRMMPPTSQRTWKKRSGVVQVWSAVSYWCSLIVCVGISCSSYSSVKGVDFTSIPAESNDLGNLIDDYRWGVVRSLISDHQYNAVLFAPPTNTFYDEGNDFRPAFRGTCERSWFGAEGIPAGMKNQIKEDNLIWQRVGEACVSLGQLDRPYAVVYLIYGQVTPMSLTVFQGLLRQAGVDHVVHSIRAMRFGVMSRGWRFQPDDVEDMEDLFAYVTEKLQSAHSGNWRTEVINLGSSSGEAPSPGAKRVTLKPRADVAHHTKAWRGNLKWLDRMRPQPWDEEDAGSHIGGLRSASSAPA